MTPDSDEGQRQGPRKRFRSISPRRRFREDYSPPRRGVYDKSSVEGGRRKAEEDSKSPPPRQRRRSRSPREDKQRRERKEKYSDGMGREPRRRDSRDRQRHSHRQRSNSRSPPPRNHQHQKLGDSGRRSERPRDNGMDSPSSSNLSVSKRSTGPLPSQQAAFSKNSDLDAVVKPEAPEKQKPNYAPSGLLAAETNTVANTSTVLKYNEPPESRLPPPSQPWRLYIFKSKDLLDTISLHTRPCWLFGREKAVADVPVEHPSASKQHAVLQFRYVERIVGEFGEKKGHVGLYIIDLDSANGTTLNHEALPKRRFVQCMSGDMIQFGESTREYMVLLPPKE